MRPILNQFFGAIHEAKRTMSKTVVGQSNRDNHVRSEAIFMRVQHGLLMMTAQKDRILTVTYFQTRSYKPVSQIL